MLFYLMILIMILFTLYHFYIDVKGKLNTGNTFAEGMTNSNQLAEYMGAKGGYDFASRDEARAKCEGEGLQLCSKEEVIAGAKSKSSLQNVCSSGWTKDAPRGWYSVTGSSGCGSNNNWNTWSSPTGKGSAHCCKPVTSAAPAGSSEELKGQNGSGYRGYQTKTRSGKTCMNWTSQDPHSHTNTPEKKPNRGLGDHNYCRNPSEPVSSADTIWCYTTDPNSRWEYCDPLQTTTFTPAALGLKEYPLMGLKPGKDDGSLNLKVNGVSTGDHCANTKSLVEAIGIARANGAKSFFRYVPGSAGAQSDGSMRTCFTKYEITDENDLTTIPANSSYKGNTYKLLSGPPAPSAATAAPAGSTECERNDPSKVTGVKYNGGDFPWDGTKSQEWNVNNQKQICEQELGKCFKNWNAEGKQGPWCYEKIGSTSQPNSEVGCAANYGSTTPSDGSNSGTVGAKYVCPESRPVCKDYKFGVNWGTCVPAPVTESKDSCVKVNDLDTANKWVDKLFETLSGTKCADKNKVMAAKTASKTDFISGIIKGYENDREGSNKYYMSAIDKAKPHLEMAFSSNAANEMTSPGVNINETTAPVVNNIAAPQQPTWQDQQMAQQYSQQNEGYTMSNNNIVIKGNGQCPNGCRSPAYDSNMCKNEIFD